MQPLTRPCIAAILQAHALPLAHRRLAGSGQPLQARYRVPLVAIFLGRGSSGQLDTRRHQTRAERYPCHARKASAQRGDLLGHEAITLGKSVGVRGQAIGVLHRLADEHEARWRGRHGHRRGDALDHQRAIVARLRVDLQHPGGHTRSHNAPQPQLGIRRCFLALQIGRHALDDGRGRISRTHCGRRGGLGEQLQPLARPGIAAVLQSHALPLAHRRLAGGDERLVNEHKHRAGVPTARRRGIGECLAHQPQVFPPRRGGLGIECAVWHREPVRRSRVVGQFHSAREALAPIGQHLHLGHLGLVGPAAQHPVLECSHEAHGITSTCTSGTTMPLSRLARSRLKAQRS